MNYIEVKTPMEGEAIQAVSAILSHMGITDFVIEDPKDVEELLEKKNAYDWDYVDDSVLKLSQAEAGITFYLEDSEAGRKQLDYFREAVWQLKEEAEECGLLLGRLSVTDRMVCDEDWKDNWKAYFKPAHITQRIVVKPTWESYIRESSEELIIEIDPGMAFGTGTHATTALCVKLLEKYLKPGDAVLDVGCGSGILSMAAALLGAKTVKGIEIDPVAVEVAKENVALNHLEDRIDVLLGDLTRGLDFRGNVILANLMADLVIMLSKDVNHHLLKDGIYISSGILIEKKELVAREIRKLGFRILEIEEEGDWCAIAAGKGKETGLDQK